MSNQIILDTPAIIATQAIDPGTLATLNEAWTTNAIQLGWICLAVGFIIGFASATLYFRRKYGRV